MIIPETQDTKSGLVQALIADQVLATVGVLTPVNLDHQSHLKTNKVKHIVHIRMLATELTTGDLPTAQLSPKMILRIRHARTQFSLQCIVND
jgi:hypothetical protein